MGKKARLRDIFSNMNTDKRMENARQFGNAVAYMISSSNDANGRVRGSAGFTIVQ